MSRRLIDCGAGVMLERAVPCTMRDGVTLYADHYYPPGGERQPTLLMRQPYGSDIASTVVYAHPVWFARHGYNVVIQDVRGRGRSEGEFYPFRFEAQDGVETIAFLRTRPESNGRIGMYGFSYQGMTQWLAAAEQPEGLECIAPAQTAHDLYAGWFYRNGALRLASSLGWGLQMLKEDARRRGLRPESNLLEKAWAELAAQYLETPYGSHPAIVREALPSYVRDWFAHRAPGEYWSAQDISAKVDKITIPALHLSGWYDTYLTGSIQGFLAMRKDSPARDQHYLLAGPWIHIPWGDRIGAADLGPEALLDTDALHLRWFHHWLKDSGEFSAEPRIRHFVLGENRWHSAEDFSQTVQTYYLHSKGRANSSKGDGVLTLHPLEADEAPDVFIYDPEVPVPAPGGFVNASGPVNQAALELGNNVLTYTTAPLERPMHVFGIPQVTICAAHSAPHTDLVAKLVDVHPNGDAVFITIGIARSQALFDEAACDTLRTWSLDLDATSCVFAAGHQMRLEIASCAYPLFDRNPNNGTAPPETDSWSWQRSTQTVFHDSARVSALYLPVVSEAA